MDFDASEREAWAGRAQAYAGSFAKLCAYPVPALLDAAGVGAGTAVLDVGTGPGTVAVAAGERGAVVSAVDAQPDMVALAARACPGADVEVAALPELPFDDGRFDAVVGNFVLNHVGRPLDALAELRRVTRPGGRGALTIWARPPAAGDALLGRAFQAASAVRPAHLPLPPADFPVDEAGFVALLVAAGWRDAGCRVVAWDHRASVEEWWSGPAAGVAFLGQVLLGQSGAVAAEVRRQYDRLSAEFVGVDGRLVLPHRALLVSATA